MGDVVQRLPYDVWLNISRFIPKHALPRLATVNRAFALLAAQATFEVLTLLTLDRDTKWLCRHLRDPHFGRGALVHRLNIEPLFVPPRVKSSHNLRRFIRNLFPNLQRRHLNRRTTKRIQKHIACVTDTVAALGNLTEYALRWDPKRKNCENPELVLFQAFLCPVLKHVGPKLVKLSLVTIPLETLSSLAPITLPHLEYLEVGICTQEIPQREIDVIFDSFTVFVNNLFPSLQSLSISSHVPSRFLDLTRFFSHLGTFPDLLTLSLSMPFDGAHLSTPSKLVAFLTRHHRTLQHLQLSASRCSPTDAPLDPSSKFWIPNILSSFPDPFPRLHTLHIALRPLKADLTPIYTFLKQYSSSLRSLTLTDRYLTIDEVATIVDCLADSTGDALGMKQLRLHVLQFTPALLIFLAEKLPQLLLLDLSFCEVIAAPPSHTGHFHTRMTYLDVFWESMRAQRHKFDLWALRTIVIPEGQPSRPWRDDLAPVLFQCIPALHDVMTMTPAS